MSKWLNNKRRIWSVEGKPKPCHKLGFCPYGRDSNNWRWYAGFFDGEGCLTISKCLTVNVTQKSLLPLKLFVSEFGGKIIKHTNNCWRWRITGKRKQQLFLIKIIPYLIVKKEEAKLALKFLDLIKKIGRQKKLTINEVKKRLSINNQLKKLNHSNNIHPTNISFSCKTFGHDCPVYYLAEEMTE